MVIGQTTVLCACAEPGDLFCCWCTIALRTSSHHSGVGTVCVQAWTRERERERGEWITTNGSNTVVFCENCDGVVLLRVCHQKIQNTGD